ncbi:MAG: ribbon-helix-helix protein, CopG family [Blastocatellia bacterium]|nr:ribbon-helix-helix protein, CopG family [Blastocatellia bacterium]
MRVRAHQITLSCSPEQKKELEAYCQKKGLSQSNVLRELLEQVMPGVWPQEKHGNRKDLSEAQEQTIE